MWLADYNLAECTKCNRLIQRKEGVTLCSRCAESEEQTPTQPTTHEQRVDTGTEIDNDVKQTSFTTSSKFIEQPEETKICSLCNRYPTLPRREYCLNCMTKLYNNLRAVTEEITTIRRRAKMYSSPEKSPEIESIRKIEPFRRIPTSGISWIKRYT